MVVASGGGRGVTAAGLVALARACRPRIVLLGRTPLPTERDELRGADELALKRAMATKARAEGRELDPAEISARVARVLAQREIRATLDALAAAGSPARYLAVDVQDADAIRAALDDVRREWGPVTALVHGAGVLADKRIIDKTDEQFDRVFDTKVAGLRALLSATARDPLESICVFSSIAARTGNLGQCDYAMANEVLNLVAASERARRGAACAVRSIGWGPWAGGMVTPSLEKHFAQMGVPLIPLDVGARMFVDELQGGGGEVTIVVGGAAGGGPLGAEAARAVSLELRVDAASHPHLADHRIAGMAVVPVAMAIEWILRGALAVRPDLACASVRDVKVLRPLKLERFDRGGDLVHVRCRQVAGDSDRAGDLRRAARPGRRAALSRGGRDGAPAAGGPADAVDAAARGLRRVRPLRRAPALPRPALPGDPRRGRDLARGDRRHAPGGRGERVAGRRVADGSRAARRRTAARAGVGPARARRRLAADGGARAAVLSRGPRGGPGALRRVRARDPRGPRGERRGLHRRERRRRRRAARCRDREAPRRARRERQRRRRAARCRDA